jgi:TonB family protein
MIRSASTTVVFALLVSACARPHTSQYAARSCPLPAGARGYPLSVRSDGAELPPTRLSAIARAVARHWPTEGNADVSPTPAQMQALHADRRTSDSAQGLSRGKWTPAPDDTVTAVLAYHSAAAPTILLPSVRDTTRFDRQILAAIRAALDATDKGLPQLDTLPLTLGDPQSDAPSSIRLRFGMEPDESDGIARFALIEEPVRALLAMRSLTYPEFARVSDIEGEVVVSFVVRPEGMVDPSTVHVARASNIVLRDAVLAALHHMQFRPAMIDCRPVSQLVVQPFTFTLQRPAERR